MKYVVESRSYGGRSKYSDIVEGRVKPAHACLDAHVQTHTWQNCSFAIRPDAVLGSRAVRSMYVEACKE